MNTDPLELAALGQKAVTIAKAAGETILEYCVPEISVTQKDDNTPLTEADLAANKYIVDQLNRIDSDIPVCTEETCEAQTEKRKSWRTYWLVDPLDGTREFLNQNGEFSVNIALIPTDDQITVAIGWAKQLSSALQSFLDNLGEHNQLRMGGALKSCLVAEGRADVYPCFGPTGEWDTAAAQCIVEEAGGKMVDTKLNPLRYNTRDSLINPDFFAHGVSNRHWPDYR